MCWNKHGSKATRWCKSYVSFSDCLMLVRFLDALLKIFNQFQSYMVSFSRHLQALDPPVKESMLTWIWFRHVSTTTSIRSSIPLHRSPTGLRLALSRSPMLHRSCLLWMQGTGLCLAFQRKLQDSCLVRCQSKLGAPRVVADFALGRSALPLVLSAK